MPEQAWLAVLQAGSARAWHAALQRAGSIAQLTQAREEELRSWGLEQTAIRRLRAPDDGILRRWSEWLAVPGHWLVTIDAAHYPPLLKQIPDPPLALWVRGRDPGRLGAAQLAIVGSRNATPDGTRDAHAFARHLGEAGLTITSGLAVGIDAASHRGAIATRGGTIAVLGSGIDVIYPGTHGDLAEAICARGLLVSEYSPGTPPQRSYFPQRNRIIAGLAAGVLVMQASLKSGSLITAKLAAEYGREVFAVPGSIHNPVSRGCHWLIREGAKLVDDAPSVLVELTQLLQIDPPPANVNASHQAAFSDDPDYSRLLQAIGFAPLAINDIVRESGLTAGEVSSMLLLLELRGLVDALPGGRYARAI